MCHSVRLRAKWLGLHGMKVRLREDAMGWSKEGISIYPKGSTGTVVGTDVLSRVIVHVEGHREPIRFLPEALEMVG